MKLRNIFKRKKAKIPIDVSYKKMHKLIELTNELNLEERLYLIRSIFGGSCNVSMCVTHQTISLNSVSNNPSFDDSLIHNDMAG